jgi:hypothetical protein
MIPADSKIALILGHPGHELRVFRFLEIHKPRLYVLTDGSGNHNISRVDSTRRIIKQTGSSASPVMGKFSDKDIYTIMREGNAKPLFDTMDEIIADMTEHKIDFVAGDSIEGFNPTHDLCRYMINAIVEKYEQQTGKTIPNYEFYLDGPPHTCPEGMKDKATWIRLSDEEFNEKHNACRNYPEILKDLEELISKHGKAPFQVECLWPVSDPHNYVTWKTEEPFYESYGKKKVATGEYNEVIGFQSHLLPLAKKLSGS